MKWKPILLLCLCLGVSRIIYSTFFSKAPQTNRQYLQDVIETHTLDKTAKAVVAKLKSSPQQQPVSQEEWDRMEAGLIESMNIRAKIYIQSNDPYLDATANDETPKILSTRLLRECGVVD